MFPLNYGNQHRPMVYNPSYFEKYQYPPMYQRSGPYIPQMNYNQRDKFKMFNEGKSKRSTVYDRKLEEMKAHEYYSIMLGDEKLFSAPQQHNYLEETINVYQFYFDEGYNLLEQRKQTLHLAMTYFKQTILSCPNLKKNEIGVIAMAALLIASKIDELDYNLLPALLLNKFLHKSKYIRHYDNRFNEEDIIECEKNICMKLDWNLNLLTPFHFMDNLIEQNITFENDIVMVTEFSNVNVHQNMEYNHQASSTCPTSLDLDENINSNNIVQTTHDLYRNRKNRMNQKSGSSNAYKENKDVSQELSAKGVKLTISDQLKIREIAHYLVQLSNLLFELQSYKPSRIAAACVLCSRKIMRVHPVWPEELERITKYEYIDLLKCMNILLDNYNEIKIGKSKHMTSDVLGRQPQPFEFKTKPAEVYQVSPVKENKAQLSVSPRKTRKPYEGMPPLGDSNKMLLRSDEKKKKTTNESHRCYPPAGILKSSARNEPKESGFELKLSAIPSSSNIKYEAASAKLKEPMPVLASKKVSFGGNMAQNSNDDSLDKNLQKANESIEKGSNNCFIQLTKYKSINDASVEIDQEKGTLKTKYRTPIDIRARNRAPHHKKFKKQVSNQQTSGKREMEPKVWKENRIRRRNKSSKQFVPLRRNFRSNERPLQSDEIFTKLLDDRRQRLGVDHHKINQSKQSNKSAALTDCSTDQGRTRLGSKEFVSSTNITSEGDSDYTYEARKPARYQAEFRPKFNVHGSYGENVKAGTSQGIRQAKAYTKMPEIEEDDDIDDFSIDDEEPGELKVKPTKQPSFMKCKPGEHGNEQYKNEMDLTFGKKKGIAQVSKLGQASDNWKQEMSILYEKAKNSSNYRGLRKFNIHDQSEKQALNLYPSNSMAANLERYRSHKTGNDQVDEGYDCENGSSGIDSDDDSHEYKPNYIKPLNLKKIQSDGASFLMHSKKTHYGGQASNLQYQYDSILDEL